MNRRSLGGKADLPFSHSRRMPAQSPSWQDELRAKAHASLSAVLQKPAATQSPRRWKKQLQDAISEAQKHAALAQAAEERAQVAEARVRELEKKTLAAQSIAREMEDRVVAAEAIIARTKETAHEVHDSPAASPPLALDDDALHQIEAAQEAMLNAEERARKAEMRARDMEQRSLAAEAIIAGSR